MDWNVVQDKLNERCTLSSYHLSPGRRHYNLKHFCDIDNIGEKIQGQYFTNKLIINHDFHGGLFKRADISSLIQSYYIPMFGGGLIDFCDS